MKWGIFLGNRGKGLTAMRTPIVITFLIFILGFTATYFIFSSCMSLSDKTGHTITLWASVGTMIAASFAIYAYWINLSAFNEARKPVIKIFVSNNKTNVYKGANLFSPNTHSTEFHYQNLSNIDCKNLKLRAFIDSKTGQKKINNLFQDKYFLPAQDGRMREIPTLIFLEEQLGESFKLEEETKLTFSYSYEKFGEEVCNSIDYIWRSDHWQLL